MVDKLKQIDTEQWGGGSTIQSLQEKDKRYQN